MESRNLSKWNRFLIASYDDGLLLFRDQFEGTPFDMTTGLDAGPYGDPMRFPPMTKWRDPVQGVTYDSYMHGTIHMERY